MHYPLKWHACMWVGGNEVTYKQYKTHHASRNVGTYMTTERGGLAHHLNRDGGRFKVSFKY